MEVKPIQEIELSERESSGHTSYFDRAFWLKVQGDRGLALGIFNKRELIGTLILYRYKKWGKEFLIHPPLAPHCGLNFRLSAEKKATRQTQVKRAMGALSDYLLDRFGKAYVEFCMPPEVVDAQPFQWNRFETTIRYTYRLDLLNSEEMLLSEMTTERRKNIKDGQKKGYKTEINGSIESLMDLLSSTAKRGGFTFQKPTIERVLADPDKRYFHTKVTKDGKPLATTLVVYDGSCAYYLSGGHSNTEGDSLAGTLSLWQAMKHSKELGCKSFDFMGSSVPDIERFFRSFGAKLIPLICVKRRSGLIAWLKERKEKL